MQDSVRDLFGEYLQGPEARVVLGITVVLVVSSVFTYFVLKIREGVRFGKSQSGDHLSNFRELYESGEMSEFEYRRVKSQLGDAIHKEALNTEADAEEAKSENESSDLIDSNEQGDLDDQR